MMKKVIAAACTAAWIVTPVHALYDPQEAPDIPDVQLPEVVVVGTLDEPDWWAGPTTGWFFWNDNLMPLVFSWRGDRPIDSTSTTWRTCRFSMARRSRTPPRTSGHSAQSLAGRRSRAPCRRNRARSA